jgi:hypothetical protein
VPLQSSWELKKPEWTNDVIPEIMDGKNIVDFVDPEIDLRLAELEAEEDERAQLYATSGTLTYDGSLLGTLLRLEDTLDRASYRGHFAPQTLLIHTVTDVRQYLFVWFLNRFVLVCEYARAWARTRVYEWTLQLNRYALQKARAAQADSARAEAQARVKQLAKTIRKKKGVVKEAGRLSRKNNHPTMSRSVKVI